MDKFNVKATVKCILECSKEIEDEIPEIYVNNRTEYSVEDDEYLETGYIFEYETVLFYEPIDYENLCIKCNKLYRRCNIDTCEKCADYILIGFSKILKTFI